MEWFCLFLPLDRTSYCLSEKVRSTSSAQVSSMSDDVVTFMVGVSAIRFSDLCLRRSLYPNQEPLVAKQSSIIVMRPAAQVLLWIRK